MSSGAGFGQGAREAALVKALQAAVAAIGAGRLDDAATVLRATPDTLKTPAGQNILGDIHLKQQRPKEALKAFDAALRLAPNMPEAYCNRGVALQDLGRYGDALAAVDRALRIRPTYATAQYNRGNILKAMHRFPEADEAYSRALALQPSFPEALLNRGVARLPLNKRMEALGDFNRALSLRPKYVAAHIGRARVYRSLSDIKQAFAAVDTALAIDPEDMDARLTRIEILNAAERFDEALTAADAILAINPQNGAALANRAEALSGLKRYDEALVLADEAVRRLPESAMAHLTRGNVLAQLYRSDEALAELDTARRFGAWGPAYLMTRGMVLNNLDRVDEAGASFEQAITLAPEDAGMRYNRSFFLLQRGRYAEGWPEHEWRTRRRQYGLGDLMELAPRWEGQDLTGKRLLVFCEQGHGDSIQFSRFLPLLAKYGAGQTTLRIQEALRRLYADNFPDMDVTFDLGMRKDFDYQIPLMSLADAFGATLDTMPRNVPYLRANDERVAKWRKRIGTDGFRIGIAWQGNPKFGADRFRSIALKEFLPLASVPGIRLISLQWVGGTSQLQGIGDKLRIETLGEEVVNNPDGFREVAAVMANLDLLITSDTGPAHLAGALGRPIWVALNQRPDWRWMNEGTTTPWYPTMRLYRQQTMGDWPGVFNAIAGDLGLVVAGEQSPLPR